MKYYYSSLTITSLLSAGRGQKDWAKSQFEPPVQTEENYSLAKEYIKEVAIIGKVLSRDLYPQEKELTLIIPFFWKMENQYHTPTQEDGPFPFRFPIYAKLREVSIRNYAEHLYIHPGDSIHVEIDLKDLLHPKVAGDIKRLNQEVLAFTESAYYYIRNHSINPDLNIKDSEAELKKEYDFCLERRNEYLTKYKPMSDVMLFTEELLKQDYYYALLSCGNQCQSKTRKEMDRYHKLLPTISKLYNKGILSARLYDTADEVERYIAYGVTYKDKKDLSVEEIMSAVGEDELGQYIYTKMAVGSLSANDTLALTTRHTQFGSIVKMLHLRAQVTQIYNQTKSYLENPQPVSNNLLYDEFHEDSKLKTSMPYMEPVHNILEKHHGKVIYFDFWARWCPLCLAEMEPLKQLRDKYSTRNLVIYSVCVSEPKGEQEECLNEYSLKNRGIECTHAPDYFGKDNLQKTRRQRKIDRMPYYLLLSKKGQTVDPGTTTCPSNPQPTSQIEEAIKDSEWQKIDCSTRSVEL